MIIDSVHKPSAADTGLKQDQKQSTIDTGLVEEATNTSTVEDGNVKPSFHPAVNNLQFKKGGKSTENYFTITKILI